ncbi:MAG: ACT domain-containing protein [Elusimicrobiota bacterium]
MNKPRKVMQLVVTTDDKPGMLADVTEALAAEKINIEAISAYGDEGEAIFYLIVHDNARALKALKANGWVVAEEEIIVVDVENKAGALHEVASKLKGAEVNLRYCYGTTSERNGPCHFIMKAMDNDKAVTALTA